MPLPTVTDYHDAVQAPDRAFGDGELARGVLKTNALGLPAMAGGGLAVTYQVTTGSRRYAVRCFHKEAPGLGARYAQISSTLKNLSEPYFVEFDYQPAGILVRGARHPIVKMDWVEGETLDLYLAANVRNTSRVMALRERFSRLEAYLRRNGIAHGDLQNLNVMVQKDELRLIDYDGMFVPGMTPGLGSEVGHKAFQHPRRSTTDFGPDMDRFSFIAVDLSLAAVAKKPELQQRYNNGGESIIFRANDYADPQGSPVFAELRAIPELKASADRLAAICAAPVAKTPTLAEFLAGQNIPAAAPIQVTGKAEKATIGYIGPYPVLRGTDYAAVELAVGERVEIVGQIISVKEGVGRRGRGRGLPYVFINFGKWNGHSVKVTLWSEGLGQLSARPSEAWVGRWISVTGLVEPPYHGSFRGQSYSSVGVTVTSDGQIVQLSPVEAKFRLGAVGSSVRKTGTSSSNKDVLTQLKTERRKPAGAAAPARTPSRPATSNQQLLATLNVQQRPNSATPSTPAPVPPPADSGSVNGWVWVIVIGVIIFLMSRCTG